MVINLYELKEKSLNKFPKSELPNSIKDKIKIIEEEIIKEFLKEQKGNIGITSLGEKIRGNTLMKQQFGEDKKQENVLIKLTENRRAFLHVFNETIYNYPSTNIYFFILEKEFGRESHLVDSSFVNLNVINKVLEKFFKNFIFKTDLGRICFVELEGLEGYHFDKNGKYSKLCKDAR